MSLILVPPSSSIMADPQQREIKTTIYVLDEHCIEAERRIIYTLQVSDEDWDNTIIQAAKAKSASLESFKEDEIHIFRTPPNLMKGIMTKQRMASLLEKLRAQLSGLPTSNADELFIELQDETFEEFFPTDEKEPRIFLLPKPYSKPLSIYKTFADGESKDIDLLVRFDSSNIAIRAKRNQTVSSILDLLKDKVTGLETTNASNYVFLLFNPPVSSSANEQTINGALTEQIQDPNQFLCDIFSLPPKANKISLLICNRKSSESRNSYSLETC